ncbi:MAG: hypothetical protein A2V93_00265 [Ignavibacteria bacterium RBG_16_34_14]|nr:MAG: hypothetical protein A2V93_00265 [Ignavibacteria bacterium RBG_16_34_14]
MDTPTKTNLKRVAAYVNTTRIHWLVEELQKRNINEILATEFFRPNSQISKLEFFCEENQINDLRQLIHSIGTCGKSADHLFIVKEVDPDKSGKSIFPFV